MFRYRFIFIAHDITSNERYIWSITITSALHCFLKRPCLCSIANDAADNLSFVCLGESTQGAPLYFSLITNLKKIQ